VEKDLVRTRVFFFGDRIGIRFLESSDALHDCPQVCIRTVYTSPGAIEVARHGDWNGDTMSSKKQTGFTHDTQET
jgi:hypothetical protein